MKNLKFTNDLEKLEEEFFEVINPGHINNDNLDDYFDISSRLYESLLKEIRSDLDIIFRTYKIRQIKKNVELKNRTKRLLGMLCLSDRELPRYYTIIGDDHLVVTHVEIKELFDAIKTLMIKSSLSTDTALHIYNTSCHLIQIRQMLMIDTAFGDIRKNFNGQENVTELKVQLDLTHKNVKYHLKNDKIGKKYKDPIKRFLYSSAAEFGINTLRHSLNRNNEHDYNMAFFTQTILSYVDPSFMNSGKTDSETKLSLYDFFLTLFPNRYFGAKAIVVEGSEYDSDFRRYRIGQVETLLRI